MKPINEKEINKQFFLTLVFFVAAALLLIVAAFLNVNLHSVEKDRIQAQYEQLHDSKRAKSSTDVTYQELAREIQDLDVNSNKYHTARGVLTNKTGELFVTLSKDSSSTNYYPKLLVESFQRQLELKESLKQEIDLNKRLKDKIHGLNERIKQEYSIP